MQRAPIPRWSEPAGAAADGTQAGADAGGLWGAAGRAAPVVGVSAQPGRKSERAWEGLLGDLYRRGLHGENLQLILTDGCAGLAAAIQTVYPRVLHQRCWVHKMRNILEHVRKRDYDEVKRGAQAIHRAENRRQAMMKALHREHELSDMFVAYLLARNIRYEEDLVDQLFNSSEKRLARILLLLAHFGKEGVPETVIPKISQETLAEMIGTTRSRVSFFMNRFRKLGFIDYHAGDALQVHSSLLNIVLHD
jgi:hypothetical protein